MEKIKSFVANVLVATIVLAGFGFAVMLVGVAIILGAAVALVIRIQGVDLMKRIHEDELSATAEEVVGDCVPAQITYCDHIKKAAGKPVAFFPFDALYRDYKLVTASSAYRSVRLPRSIHRTARCRSRPGDKT